MTIYTYDIIKQYIQFNKYLVLELINFMARIFSIILQSIQRTNRKRKEKKMREKEQKKGKSTNRDNRGMRQHFICTNNKRLQVLN